MSAEGEGLAITPAPGGVRFPVVVQPRASRERITGLHDGALRVAVKAPPVDGKANAAVLALLAAALDVARGRIAIRSGSRARRKWVQVEGTPEELEARLRTLARSDQFG